MSRSFFRIIRGPSATLDDFKSSKLLGKPPRDPTMRREWAEGISVFESFEYATARARAVHFRLGMWIVELAIPEESAVEWAQTGRDVRRFTIYASPFEALSFVIGEPVFVGDDQHG